MTVANSRDVDANVGTPLDNMPYKLFFICLRFSETIFKNERLNFGWVRAFGSSTFTRMVVKV
jgi:hypothetical protein